ncbi:MAG: hypothetical protein LUQ38_12745 [Methanotrichaceae archaeon]|nr:hypothetical protein [Methanotrichaceae archaeon]
MSGHAYDRYGHCQSHCGHGQSSLTLTVGDMPECYKKFERGECLQVNPS